MTVISIQRTGYAFPSQLIADVIADLLANGFSQKFPTTPFTKPASPTTAYKVFLEAGESVDPLNAAALPADQRQPWRIAFDVTGAHEVFAGVATPLQFRDDGTFSQPINGYQSSDYWSGNIGAPTGSSISSPPQGFALSDKGFVRRSDLGANSQQYPLSYRLTVAKRGIALFVWGEGMDHVDAYHSWLVVQRPVKRDTGDVVVEGKAPVFCVNSAGGKIWHFTVRESDILRPTPQVDATVHSEDMRAIINDKAQVAISEDNKYVIEFPSHLNTQRYAYTHELDLIAVTSADVISQHSDTNISVYGEQTSRTYRAMRANAANNTGMRLLMLTAGGHVDAAPVTP